MPWNTVKKGKLKIAYSRAGKGDDGVVFSKSFSDKYQLDKHL